MQLAKDSFVIQDKTPIEIKKKDIKGMVTMFLIILHALFTMSCPTHFLLLTSQVWGCLRTSREPHLWQQGALLQNWLLPSWVSVNKSGYCHRVPSHGTTNALSRLIRTSCTFDSYFLVLFY